MRRPRLGLLLAAASALLVACGDSKPPIVFDSTTQPAPTTTVDSTTTLPGATDPPDTLPPVTQTPDTEVQTPGTSFPAASDTTLPTPPDSTDAPTTTTAAAPCTTAGCSGPQLVPYPTLTQVDQLGTDPVRGDGCGLADPFGDQMRDGLYFGLLYPADGAVSFDVACPYYGDSAVAEGADPANSEFHVENIGTRQRRVPLAAGFVYRVGTWTPDAQCVDAGPIGDGDWQTVTDGTAAWLTIAGGEATSAVALCPL